MILIETFTDLSAELTAQVSEAIALALAAMGEAAVPRMQETMRSGYGTPVVDTGALLRDVDWAADARTLRIGSSLPYALPVHNGTLDSPARPYLTDGLLAALGELEAVCRDTLAAVMGG